MATKLVWEADVSQAMKGIIKLTRVSKEAENAAGRAERRQKKTQQEMGKTTQSSIAGIAKQALGAAAAYLSVQAAARAALKVVRELEAERKAGAARLLTDIDQTKRLAQVADVPGAGPDTLANLIKRSDVLAAQTGIDPAAAKGIIFQGKSIGALAETETLARRIASFTPSTAAPGILESAFTIQQNLPGLSMAEILNVLGRGAQRTKLSLAQFGTPLAEAAPIAKLVQREKFNIEEIAAAAGVIVGPTTSPEKAITQLNRFLVGAGEAGLGGLDIPELLERVAKLRPVSAEEKAGLQRALKGPRGAARTAAEARIAQGAQFAKIFGRVEAQKFFSSAGSPEQIQRIRDLEQELILARKATGTAASFIAEREAITTGDPILSSLLRGERAKQSLAAKKSEIFGIKESRTQARLNEEIAKQLDSDIPALPRKINEIFARTLQSFGASEEQIADAFSRGTGDIIDTSAPGADRIRIGRFAPARTIAPNVGDQQDGAVVIAVREQTAIISEIGDERKQSRLRGN